MMKGVAFFSSLETCTQTNQCLTICSCLILAPMQGEGRFTKILHPTSVWLVSKRSITSTERSSGTTVVSLTHFFCLLEGYRYRQAVLDISTLKTCNVWFPAAADVPPDMLFHGTFSRYGCPSYHDESHVDLLQQSKRHCIIPKQVVRGQRTFAKA